MNSIFLLEGENITFAKANYFKNLVTIYMQEAYFAVRKLSQDCSRDQEKDWSLKRTFLLLKKCIGASNTPSIFR